MTTQTDIQIDKRFALEIPGFPTNWEDCSLGQLRWLAEYGTYGQRIIATRHMETKKTVTA